MHSKPTAKIEYDLTKTNKQKNLQSTCSFQKKKKTHDVLPFFPDYISILQTFSGSEKLLGKFQDFSKNLRLSANPEVNSLELSFITTTLGKTPGTHTNAIARQNEVSSLPSPPAVQC